MITHYCAENTSVYCFRSDSLIEEWRKFTSDMESLIEKATSAGGKITGCRIHNDFNEITPVNIDRNFFFGRLHWEVIEP